MQRVKNIKKRRDPLQRYKRIIYCPVDGKRHIDEGRFAKVPHKKHLCVRIDPNTEKLIKHFFTLKKKSIGI